LAESEERLREREKGLCPPHNFLKVLEGNEIVHAFWCFFDVMTGLYCLFYSKPQELSVTLVGRFRTSTKLYLQLTNSVIEHFIYNITSNSDI